MTNKILKNTFFFNTSIIIISGFIIKILGLLNKIIITRFLGTSGMTLYIMSFPTILLFLNIANLNINNSVSKITAESTITNKYSQKTLIKKALQIVLWSSLITITILILIIRPLTNYFLNNKDLFYPVLTTIFLIPLTSITDVLKGFYNGLKQITKTTIASLIEQISRITFTITSLYLLKPYGIIVSATTTLLALSIGEACSMVYLLKKIKKENLTDFPSPNPTKEILSLAIPTTASKLIGSFTYFLEPIIYTWILIKLNYASDIIQSNYTIINAYTIPLLTTASFISVALSTTIIPSISENYALNKLGSIKYLIDKLLLFSLIPSLFISLILFFYPNEFMQLIYGTNLGTTFIKPFVFIFLLYYLQMPFMAILHAISKTKIYFLISTFFSFLKLILIIVLAFIPSIGINSIFYAVVISIVLNSITVILLVFKYTKYQINYSNILTLLFITLISTCLLIIFNKIISNFLINTLLIGLIYLFLCYCFNLIDIKSLKRS